MNTWIYLLRVALFKPEWFALRVVLAIGYRTAPLVGALFLREIFDAFTGDAEIGNNIWVLVALFAAADAGSRILDVASRLVGDRLRYWVVALLRSNIFRGIMMRPMSTDRPSTGDIINRIVRDVEDTASPVDLLSNFCGFLVATVFALYVMASISPMLTLAGLAPILLIVLVTRFFRERFQSAREAAREASGNVTGFIAEMLNAVLAIQVAATQQQVVRRMDLLADHRRREHVKEDSLDIAMYLMAGLASRAAVGALMIASAHLLASGALTVGDFVLFVSYLMSATITAFPFWMGQMVAISRRSRVSLERLYELVPESGERGILVSTPASKDDSDMPNPVYPTGTNPLEHLEIQGLSYAHPRTGRGIHEIDLSLERGTMTVITGRIGSGKTTLLETLLGLLPADSGKVLCNGQPVAALNEFMVPPRCAYTPQVPVLFSETVRENVLLGLETRSEALHEAVRLAVLEPDIADLTHGLDTVIGPRGVRLSGGQIQRTAAARMFVRKPELLIFDDLSSALDSETEQLLWERLSKLPDTTSLVVSHRREAYRQADQIVVLREGRVLARGRLDELMETSEEVRRLWHGDLGGE